MELNMELKNKVVGYVEVDGVNLDDYPDFCDAYFSYAEFEDGTPLDELELEELTDLYPDVVGYMAFDFAIGA